MKVPISVAWLSENALLEKAIMLIGYDHLIMNSASATGISAMLKQKPVRFLWTDEIVLTTAELKQLGFE